ncbi:DHH family phosphoesterase [Acutalibacter caecimuris]|uniref:DHH family phosphoesterase n=1 Tax=Acutalibacter caecimuris TaxID=3093657 RepID=UPI002AC9EBFE|nr:DHH family phosphoesterase [Acutalibacter sp. M00118]
MRRKKVWVTSPLMYLMAAAMLVMAAASYPYSRVVFAVELTAAGLCCLAVAVSAVLYRQNAVAALRAAGKVLGAEETEALQEFALPVAVVAPAGDLVWVNNAFAQTLGAVHPGLGESILRYIYPKTFRQVMEEKGVAVSYGGREYTVYGARTGQGYIVYFVDDTYFKAISKEYRERRPVVCLAVFDNRDEMARDGAGGEDSRITAEVEQALRGWVLEELQGFIRKLSSGRYLFVTDDAHIEEAKQKRFQVLDRVREVKNSRNTMSATVSIGVGRGAVTVAESERWARQALEMALGRGGDQVAVTQGGDTYEFFGGLSKGVEKRDKVRTRVIAATLSDHVAGSDRVFVIGHTNSDLDSVGSAVGMWAAIRKGLEKQANIVINRGSTLAGTLVDMIDENYQGEEVFISPGEAMQQATERSLLIVVDTHSTNYVESRELLERIPRVVVIDHHRMMVTHIKNALIFYHEPYASSASEMVTELVQYIRSSAIDRTDAQALLAGIMLDTKNFVLKTGVRTFEASAYLRRRGADTVSVKKLFSNTLDSYKRKAQLVSGAEIYKGCAIATSSWELDDLRVAAAQAADELLSIQGVKASFVLYKMGGDVSMSARSLGDVNVQLILEEFGGGGHFTMAGAQIKNVSLGEARRMLIRALDVKLKEMTVQ